MSESTPRPAGRRIIRASEIGEYVYCHRAWWLGRIKDVENRNRAALAAGIERHRSHGTRVRQGLALRRLAVLLLAAALIVALALAWTLLTGSA